MALYFAARLFFNAGTIEFLINVSPNTGNDSTYASMNFRLNRRLSVEYRVDPYVDPRNERVFNQTLGLRTQMSF